MAQGTRDHHLEHELPNIYEGLTEYDKQLSGASSTLEEDRFTIAYFSAFF